MKSFRAFVATVGALGFFVLMPANGCGSEGAGRARNAQIGVSHAADLNTCLDQAKASDAGDRYALYESCAANVDTHYGKKP